MNLHIVDDHQQFRESLFGLASAEVTKIRIFAWPGEMSEDDLSKVQEGDIVWTDYHKPYEVNGKRALLDLRKRVGRDGRIAWMTGNFSGDGLREKEQAAREACVDLIVYKGDKRILFDDLPGTRRFFRSAQHKAFSKARMWEQLLPAALRELVVGRGIGLLSGSKAIGVVFHVNADAAGRHALCNVLPTMIDDFAVEVLPVGEIVPAARTFRRPAPAGISISHVGGPVGTLGAYVQRNGGDESIYLLSCNHVMGLCGAAAEGDLVLQPGVQDSGIPDAHGIARLAYTHPVDLDSEDNTIDAALARLDDAGCRGEEIFELGPCAGPYPLEGCGVDELVGRPVRMRGRSSPPVEGIIAGVFDLRKDQFPFGPGRTGFRNQIVVQRNDGRNPFSLLGDSGALVLDQETNEAIGMVFGHSAPEASHEVWVTYVNPIDELMKNLNIAAIL